MSLLILAYSGAALMDSKGHTKTHIIFLLSNIKLLSERPKLYTPEADARREYFTSGKTQERKIFPFFRRES
jgi:hypothetical protein